MFKEYEEILAGVRNGTLAPQPTPPPPVPKMVQAKRFSHSHGAGSFCEQFNSKKWSPIGYSFGNFHRSDAALVFISKELSKGEAGISPGAHAAATSTATATIVTASSAFRRARAVHDQDDDRAGRLQGCAQPAGADDRLRHRRARQRGAEGAEGQEPRRRRPSRRAVESWA